LGYVEGRNIIIEWRHDEGRADLQAESAAELVRLNVDVIVTAGLERSIAAWNATRTIPIVTMSGDSVGSGLATSLASPGGNVTGLTDLGPGLSSKRLELLREATPRASRTAVLATATNSHQLQLRALELAAQTLGVELQLLQVRGAEDFGRTLTLDAGRRSDVLVVVHSGFMYDHRAPIFAFVDGSRLPTMYADRDWALAGGLMAYGPSLSDLARRAATYVDKILKGAKPADLPIEQPTMFDLVINLKTAHALGLTIPQSVLQQATEILQ